MEPGAAVIMAALALMVALGSLSLSAATFWRNRTPRPVWETKVAIVTASDGQRLTTGVATNRGRGVALDMRFTPEDFGVLERSAQRTMARAEFGQSVDNTLGFDANA